MRKERMHEREEDAEGKIPEKVPTTCFRPTSGGGFQLRGGGGGGRQFYYLFVPTCRISFLRVF